MAEQMPLTDYAYHFRKWHNETDSHFAGMAGYFARKLRRLDVLRAGDRVLDIGCGWGFCLGALAQLGVTDTEGYDIDPTAVALCRRRNLQAHLLTVPGIAPWMAERSSRYDAILAFDVLEHVPPGAVPRMLLDICGALKPGGAFVCQVPNADSIIASHMRYADHTHHAAFTATSLDALLHDAGFAPATVTDADMPELRPPWREILRDLGQLKMWLIKRIARKAMRAVYAVELGSEGWRVPLDKNIIAVARRPA